ncbi:MAG: PD-(D/E)XK nuclease family protein [Nitrospinae bacterium]|nr:PD-(D/E)XK nuclease family protein [Nitrospinota bacterium]
MGETLHIYPTRLRIEEELSKSDFAEGVIFTDSMMSFGEFEEKLADELVRLKPVEETTRWLFLHDSAVSASSGSPQISALAEAAGFVRTTGELIQQIKLGLVSGAELEKIRGFAPGKEEWLRRAFGRYDGRLREVGALDSADITSLLLKKLSNSRTPPACLRKFDEILVHGVYHFTPARFELLRLLGRLLRVNLRFPLPDGRRKAFEFVERDIQKFQSLGDDAGLLELSFDEPSPDGGPLGKFVETLFAETRPEPIEDLADHVEVFYNSGRYREVEEAAGRILQLRGGGGGSFSDFCLVFRDLEKYGSIVEEVFRRAGIPVYMRRGIPVRSNPYVKCVLGVFEALEKEMERDEVSKLASSQYFSFLPEGTEPPDVDRLLMRAGITDGPLPTWRRKLSAVKKSAGEKRLSAKILRLVALMEKLGGATRAGRCLAAFKDVLAALRPRETTVKQRFFARDAYCKGRLDAVMNGLEGSLERSKMRDARFNWRDLKNLLVGALGNMNAPRWSGGDHVYALNVHELAGRSFKTVFMLGLHDGEFPARIQRGSILTESEKKEFNKRHAEAVFADKPGLARGRAVFSHAGESWDEESFIFYLSARSATERLVFSKSAADLDGRELMPSQFLEEIMDNFPRLVPKNTPVVALEKRFEEQLDPGAQRSKMLAELFDPSERADKLRPYFRRLSAGRGFLLACEKSRIERERISFYREFDPEKRGAASGRFTGLVSSPAALEGFFKVEVGRDFSATGLERYSKCPFRYFMRDVLRCEPADVPAVEVEKTFEGNVVHSVLERYYEKAGGGFRPLAERRERMRRVMDVVFAEFEKKGVEGEPAMWKITKRRLAVSLKMYVDWEEGFYAEEPFETLETEFAFGGKKGKPLEINVAGERLRFNGFIDRVDYIPKSGKLRVVDYKYSSNLAVHEKLLDPEKFFIESFQAPIYLMAALKNFGKSKNAVGARAAYVSLKKGTRGTKPVESPFDTAGAGESLGELEASEEFGGRVLGLVRRMEGGDFSVSPRDCVFCRYRRACRYVEVRESARDE